jgi:hypothetical protein
MRLAILTSPESSDQQVAAILHDVAAVIASIAALAATLLVAFPLLDGFVSDVTGGLRMALFKLMVFAVGAILLAGLSFAAQRSSTGARLARFAAPWVLTWLAGMALCFGGLVGLSVAPVPTLGAMFFLTGGIVALALRRRSDDPADLRWLPAPVRASKSH